MGGSSDPLYVRDQKARKDEDGEGHEKQDAAERHDAFELHFDLRR